MDTRSRGYLKAIGFLPWAHDISSMFYWRATAEGADFWHKDGHWDSRQGNSKKATRKVRQLRKTAFRLGYRNANKFEWRP